MKRIIGVYGAGGCGRGILPLIRNQLASHDENLIFIEDVQKTYEINGVKVLSWDQFCKYSELSLSVCIAIADSKVREQIAAKCDANNIPLFEARAQQVVQMDNVVIGDGACLSPFVTLTSNIQIGRCFHANLYSYVEHDCILGDFVTFAPDAKCNGNVIIEDHVYVGSGAIIKQGSINKPTRIGRGAVIGMGAIVTGNVAEGVTMVGNPARAMIRK